MEVFGTQALVLLWSIRQIWDLIWAEQSEKGCTEIIVWNEKYFKRHQAVFSKEELTKTASRSSEDFFLSY